MFDPSLYSQSDSDNSILSDVSCTISGFLSSCGVDSEWDQAGAGYFCYAKVLVARSAKVYLNVRDLSSVSSHVTFLLSIAVAAEILLVSSLSTVDCERGFYMMNLIKTYIRNKLAISNQILMRISLHKSDMTNFNKWSAVIKLRRILM